MEINELLEKINQASEKLKLLSAMSEWSKRGQVRHFIRRAVKDPQFQPMLEQVAAEKGVPVSELWKEGMEIITGSVKADIKAAIDGTTTISESKVLIDKGVAEALSVQIAAEEAKVKPDKKL